MNKKCNKCQEIKDVSEFYKKANRGDGLAGYTHVCKVCTRTTTRKYKRDDVDKFDKLKYSQEYKQKNKEKLDEYYIKWKNENEDNLRIKRQEYYQKNKERIKRKNYDYCKRRKTYDPLYKLRLGIRSLILLSFKSNFTKKSKKTSEILGCTFEDFKIYLESKFDENMNWENQGTYWHLDHIIPISSAQTEQEVYKLNHYTNFQPLYWLDNLKKSNKI